MLTYKPCVLSAEGDAIARYFSTYIAILEKQLKNKRDLF